MADAADDPESGRAADDPSTEEQQALLQGQYPAAHNAPSRSVFRSMAEWTRWLRHAPAPDSEAAALEAPNAAQSRQGASSAQPSSASGLSAAGVSRHPPSAPGSPSASSPVKSGTKTDLEAIALRSIDAICDDGSGLKRCVSGTCVICMETLTPEEFASGEAMTLECMCKGDMALRHKSCAVKWAQVKGSIVCDICKAPITNLPPMVFDDDLEEGMGEVDMGEQLEEVLQRRDEIPAAADYVFDCIRVTWVSMIICILFFNASVSKSFVTGLMIGVAYTAFCKAMHRSAQYRAALLASNSPDTPHGPTGPVLVLA